MTTGTVAISVAGSDLELRHLAGWLRGEDELRGRVDLVEEAVRPGQRGAVADSVVVMVTSDSAVTLFSTLFDWLDRRRQVTKVSLKIRNAQTGGEMELSCGSAADAQEVLTRVRRFLDDRA